MRVQVNEVAVSHVTNIYTFNSLNWKKIKVEGCVQNWQLILWWDNY